MKNKREMLLSYIRANVAPILVDFIFGKDIEGAIVLPATIDSKELNGKYHENDFLPPKWLKKIIDSNVSKILVIDKIDSIDKQEQSKFIEILKYRQISTFKLPEGCVIIVTANKIDKDSINEEIFSLVASI